MKNVATGAYFQLEARSLEVAASLPVGQKELVRTFVWFDSFPETIYAPV
jgi:hypothetical protein